MQTHILRKTDDHLASFPSEPGWLCGDNSAFSGGKAKAHFAVERVPPGVYSGTASARKRATPAPLLATGPCKVLAIGDAASSTAPSAAIRQLGLSHMFLHLDPPQRTRAHI
eukprot:7146933-Pyramimonas_sp.AAC.1